MKQVLLYIHGKGGNAREASRYRPLCPAYEYEWFSFIDPLFPDSFWVALFSQ